MCLSRQALLSKMTRPVRPLRKHVTVSVHTHTNLWGGMKRQLKGEKGEGICEERKKVLNGNVVNHVTLIVTLTWKELGS